MERKTVPAVKALIKNEEGNFLAIKTDAPQSEPRWGLPGGKIEYGESPREALKREVREEVSLDIEIGEVIGVFDFFYRQHQIVPAVFVCQGKGEVELQEGVDGHQTIEDYEWLSIAEFEERDSLEGLKNIVTGYFR